MGKLDTKDAKRIYTPEEREMRAKIARKRFKFAMRTVLANVYWLKDEESELSTEIETFMRKPIKRKMMLNFREKLLLRKPAESRTAEEKAYLVKILGSLRCFRLFPREVKNELACVAYFFYMPPNRVIVRQQHEAKALYILISGTAVSEKDEWDEFLNEYKTIHLGELVPGNMFGEICLLHNVPRSSTVRTITHCEFLYLKRRDFDNVLKQTVQLEWDLITNAMSRFEYFSNWSSHALRECCTLSRILTFNLDETIYGDKIGLSNYAYFILKGRCKMIQYLRVTSKVINGIKKYRLYEDEKEIKVEKKFDSEPSSEVVSVKSASVLPEKPQRKSDFIFVEDSSKDVHKHKKKKSEQSRKSTIEPKLEPELEPEPELELEPEPEPEFVPENVEKYFIQICILSELECFGIGEDLKDRRIVAMTPVTCLVIPIYYLMKNNVGNLWNRIRQFLNMQLPSKEAVFNEFNNNRKWLLFRKNIVDGCLSKHKRPNNTTIHDVPLSLRAYEYIQL